MLATTGVGANPYSAIQGAIQSLVTSTVDFMSFIAAVLIVITIGGLGILGFLALVQSLIGYSLIEWSSIKRIIGALVTMGVIIGLLTAVLPTVLNAAGLTSIATAINSFMSMTYSHITSLI